MSACEEEHTMIYTGVCICKGVGFTVKGPPEDVFCCYCSDCAIGAGGPCQIVSGRYGYCIFQLQTPLLPEAAYPMLTAADSKLCLVQRHHSRSGRSPYLLHDHRGHYKRSCEGKAFLQEVWMHSIYHTLQPRPPVHRHKTSADRKRVRRDGSPGFNTLLTFAKPRNLQARAGMFCKATS